MASYEQEHLAVPYLPSGEDFVQTVNKHLAHLLEHGLGVVALDGGKVTGFLAGYPVPEFFGEEKGVYCPLFGHGSQGTNSKKVYQKLYEHAAALWVKQGYTSHGVTVFAHGQETIDTWFWLGFGLRCVDAIREVSSVPTVRSGVVIREADEGDIPSLADLHREHHLFYRSSPMFMPTKEEEPVDDLIKWMGKENHHLWIAYAGNEPMGYMRIQPDGESFVAEHPQIMNISGAYVTAGSRNSGVGVVLLNAIQQWLVENDYRLFGVDFEASNVMGSGFWTKHFTPYTYSMTRRVDERILKCR